MYLYSLCELFAFTYVFLLIFIFLIYSFLFVHSLLLLTGPHFGEARDKDLFDTKIRRDQPATEINSAYKLTKMLNSCLKLCHREPKR